LLQYSQINELPAADSFNVCTLRKWLQNPDSANRAFHIEDHGSDSWGDLKKHPVERTLGQQFIHMLRSLSIFWVEKEEPNLHHLVVPGKCKDVDGLTRWVTNEWIPFWHKIRSRLARPAPKSAIGHDPEAPHLINKEGINSASTFVSRIFRRKPLSKPPTDNTPGNTTTARSKLITYRIGRIRTFTSFITTVVACLLPTAAIAILATMHSTPKVLGFIGLFTAIFAMGLMGLTDSGTSRTEIFTATAAYVLRGKPPCEVANVFGRFSAVLVVFVQNQSGPPSVSSGG